MGSHWGNSLEKRTIGIRSGWNDWNYCKRQIAHDGCLIQNVPQKLRSESLCLAAVRQNGIALKFIETQTLAICQAAVAQNPDALQYVSDEYLDAFEEIGPSPC